MVLVSRTTPVLIFIPSDLMHPLCRDMTEKLLTRINSIILNKKKSLVVLRGQFFLREPSGSVVECLTHDRGAVGLSLPGVTAFCP